VLCNVVQNSSFVDELFKNKNMEKCVAQRIQKAPHKKTLIYNFGFSAAFFYLLIKVFGNLAFSLFILKTWKHKIK